MGTTQPRARLARCIASPRATRPRRSSPAGPGGETSAKGAPCRQGTRRASPDAACAGRWSNVFEALSPGFTLLALGKGMAHAPAFAAAAAHLGMPLTLLAMPEAGAAQAYEDDLVLVRPDQYVAWAGDDPAPRRKRSWPAPSALRLPPNPSPHPPPKGGLATRRTRWPAAQAAWPQRGLCTNAACEEDEQLKSEPYIQALDGFGFLSRMLA